MFKTLTQRMNEKVDERAEAEKRCIEYVAQLVEENKDILLSHIGENFNGDVEEEMFSLMEKALNYIGRCYVYRGPEETKDEREKYNKLYTGIRFVYIGEDNIRKATTKGKKAYNKYRELKRV